MPLGACVARKSVMDWSRGSHGNTFGGNPLSCAAALATIDLIENEYLENAEVVGTYTQDALQEIMARHPSIGDVRGIGLMIGVEFVKDRKTKVPAETLCNHLIELAFERGLILLSCGKSVVRIAPALSISKSEIDEGLKIFEEALILAEKETK
jgi:4-aminobutyrate aminotransferase